MEDLIKNVKYFIEKHELKKKCIQPRYVHRRIYFFYILREAGATYQEIADLFDLNHATVIHGIKKVENALNGFNRELFKINRFTQIMVTNERKYCNQIRRGKIAPTKVYKKAMR